MFTGVTGFFIPHFSWILGAISVTGDAVVGAILTAVPNPSNAIGSYQWQFSEDAGTTWTNIPANGTSSTYAIAADYAGDLIRVVFTASGSFTGTQNSAATAAVLTQTEVDNADITAAKGAIEAATYTATQAEAGDAAAALTKAQALVDALGASLEGTTAAVVAGDFTAAVAGTAGTPAGTNGSYTFTVTINKGGGTEQTSAQQTMTITATAYVTASASAITSETDTTTITLSEAITGLAAGDIVVKVGGSALDNSGSDKYTLGGLDSTSVTIAFLAGASLDNTSVITVEMTKAGYTINGGVAIAVTNNIPAP